VSKRNETVIDFMKSRRSVPANLIGDPGPSTAQVGKLIAIATRVPDHGKIAPWRFVRYSNAAKKRLGEALLARATEIAMAGDRPAPLSDEQQMIERSRFSRSPQVVVMISSPRQHPKVPQWEQVLSAGAAGMNLLIAANAYGYDAQWITEWYAYDEKLARELGAGDGERIAGFFHFGTRTMPKTERDRPQLTDIFSTMDI